MINIVNIINRNMYEKESKFLDSSLLFLQSKWKFLHIILGLY